MDEYKGIYYGDEKENFMKLVHILNILNYIRF